jgi:hypothetical protein|nr:MAG TPA: protein of unknown function (DUF2828) [Caudoviricetes sp.]
MTELDKLFAEKRTENGDIAYNTTGDNLLDILFMSEYYSKHIDEAARKIGSDDIDKLFAMFIRDPRFGLGKKDLGVALEVMSDVSWSDMAKAGRFDDFFRSCFLKYVDVEDFTKIVAWVFSEAKHGNELAKKWLPRFNTKGDNLAKTICSYLNISQKTYRKTIKTGTVENKLSSHKVDEINFEQVPSLALMKYYDRFSKEPRFKDYLDKVKKGTAKLNVATTTIYDIYKNRDKIDATLFFDKLEKIRLSCIPILDTSGSMWDSNDSIGKAVSIAYYLAKCSTYCNNQVVSFSSKPQLINIVEKSTYGDYYGGWSNRFGNNNKFSRELNSMYTGDCTNTNFGAVIELLGKLNEFPDYFVVLSDMEFDYGSSMKKDQVMQLFKDRGIKTKIVWWNFNSRNTTAPEMDNYGNIYMSGYSPMLLKYLQAGFDGKQFLYKLLDEYKKNIEK